jgi:WD40 repeat protein
VVRYSAADRSLISGGQKGEISIYDLRQQRIRTQWAAHALAVRSLALDESAAATSFYSASTDGDIKLWGVGAPGGQSGHSGGTRDGAEMPPRMAGHWPRAHEPHTMLHPLAGTTLGRTYGVNWMVRDGASRLLTAGADGKLNLWLVLPTSVKR